MTNTPARFCLFSPDGRQLAVRYVNGEVRLWDFAERTVRFTLPGGKFADPNALAFSADGSILAATDRRTKELHFYQTTNGQVIASALIKDVHVAHFVAQDLETVLVDSASEGLRLMRWRSGEVVKKFAVPEGNGLASVSHDGRWVAAATYSGPVILWDMSRGTTNTIEAHGKFVSQVLFHPTSPLLATRSWDGTTKLWELASRRLLLTTPRGYAMAFSDDGERLVYLREKSGIGFWRLQRSNVHSVLGASPDPTMPYYGPAFTPDGRWLAVSSEAGIAIADTVGLKFVEQIPFDNFIYSGLSFTRDGRELWATAPQGVRRWKFNPPVDRGLVPAAAVTQPAVLSGSEMVPGTKSGEVEGFGFVGTNQLMFARNREEVVWLDMTSNQVIRKIGPHPGLLAHSASPDLHWLATAGRHGARTKLWNLQTGKLDRVLDERDAVVSFSPDGKWLALSLGYELVLLDTKEWQARPGFPREITSGLPGIVCWSSDSRWLAMLQSEHLLQIIDAESGKVRASLPSPNPEYIHGFQFSPDNQRMYVSVGSELQMWELAKLEKELDAMGLGWKDEQSQRTGGLATRQSKLSENHPLGLLFALVGGGGVLAALVFGVAVFRRNRQWLRDYVEVEDLVVNREQELKAAQQEILLSQKMKALGTLAAGVAHDFNNLLSVVRMANKSIHREASGQAEVVEGTNDIEEAVMEGKRLVQSMLGYSRNSAGPLGPYELSGVVEDTVALLTRQFLSGIELALDLDPAVPATIGSRGRLRQILLNLIVNASEAMGGQGTLRITLKTGFPLSDGVLFLRPEPATSYARLTVADTGPGMPPEILPRVFEPFFTTKNSGDQRGTGLGLSLVYALAEQEGMGIQVESTPGQGAVFHLFIPLRKSLAEIDTDYLSVTRPSPVSPEARRLPS